MYSAALCHLLEMLLDSHSGLQLQPTSRFSQVKSGAEYVNPFLMVFPLYRSRLAQCFFMAHHGNWVPSSPRPNCAGSWSTLKAQRYNIHGTSVYGYAMAPINPIIYRQRLGEGTPKSNHTLCNK